MEEFLRRDSGACHSSVCNVAAESVPHVEPGGKSQLEREWRAEKKSINAAEGLKVRLKKKVKSLASCYRFLFPISEERFSRGFISALEAGCGAAD